ncbi:hypothetical protein B0H10DRAFT_2083694 [Mycena sp. CBHHK59/15]|nr:hypothetical protein B0H10DRAFT_2083694 [Mycena sp. CBHHK59/15]
MSYRLGSSALKLRSPVGQIGKRYSSGHGDYKHFPFDTTQTITHRKKFAAKCAAFMGAGFCIPFGAIYVHWNRPGGLKNP